jgi:hypothetical protein
MLHRIWDNLLLEEMFENSQLSTRSREDWVKSFVDWKNRWRRGPDPEQSTISNSYVGDDYLQAIADCVSLLGGDERVGQLHGAEEDTFKLEVNSQVDPIPGLKFMEDPRHSGGEGHQSLEASYDKLYERAEYNAMGLP